MGGPLLVSVCSLLLIAAAVGVPAAAAEVGQRDATSTYIVYVAHAHAPRPSSQKQKQKQKQNASHLLTRAYTSFLRDTLPAHISDPAPPIILYSYAHATTGFAARLTARQAAHLESQPSVLAVVPDRELKLHTTLSPSFLDLTPFSRSRLVQASNGGTDAVIAVLDTGIYPNDRASFSADPWLPPPPPTFRGGCVSAPDFNPTAYCNNKLVGAKFFGRGYEEANGSPVVAEIKESMSPLDINGHGTHCASIAAGSAVQNANFLGFAKGTAMGAAPGARIASYKVCWGSEAVSCMDSDIIAGVDAAIADNVNVISMSLGRPHSNLYDEATATATFSAVRKGIFVAAAAGNSGPATDTVCNLAPWVVTVGASTMNRRFLAPVNLGNGRTFLGASLYKQHNGYEYGQMKPLIYGGDAGSRTCEVGKLVIPKVAGKIVLCDPGDEGQAAQGVAVQEVGAAGAIVSGLQINGEYVEDTAFQLPAVAVTSSDAEEIKAYSKTPNAVASIAFFSTVITNGPHPSYPSIASFSSRGPNRAAPEILKPDVVAPGVSILAAWSGESPPTPSSDARRVEFNIFSGTSMATPHVNGVAAMLKVARPSWSPAAIKSALMTTALSEDSTGDTIKDMATGMAAGPFEMGAGHMDPNRALDPGLVYDAGTDDYVSFLCALGYTPSQIARFTGEDMDCSARVPTTVGNLNSPAFSVVFKAYGETVEQRRVVHNVGSNVNAVYKIGGVEPAGVTVSLRPPDGTLVFDSQHQTREYTAAFTAVHAGNYTRHTYGRLELTDGLHHKVVSPIAVTWPAPSAIAAMCVAPTPMHVCPVATV